MLVYRISGSPIALALKDRLKQDNMGATSMATGPYLMKPPGTILTYYPLYTDEPGGHRRLVQRALEGKQKAEGGLSDRR